MDRRVLSRRPAPLATFNGKDFADFGEYDGLRLFDVS
jgi:hypothetical protein